MRFSTMSFTYQQHIKISMDFHFCLGDASATVLLCDEFKFISGWLCVWNVCVCLGLQLSSVVMDLLIGLKWMPRKTRVTSRKERKRRKTKSATIDKNFNAINNTRIYLETPINTSAKLPVNYFKAGYKKIYIQIFALNQIYLLNIYV